jgi:hypothetical protein
MSARLFYSCVVSAYDYNFNSVIFHSYLDKESCRHWIRSTKNSGTHLNSICLFWKGNIQTIYAICYLSLSLHTSPKARSNLTNLLMEPSDLLMKNSLQFRHYFLLETRLHFSAARSLISPNRLNPSLFDSKSFSRLKAPETSPSSADYCVLDE